MLHIALFEPEIPPNTGNIIRLCANTGVQLHLIHPLGFAMDEKQLKRAGLDYHEFTQVIEHQNYAQFLQWAGDRTIFACSTKGELFHHEVSYQKNNILLFGPETRGLPVEIRESLPKNQVIRIPMVANSRSLNLSNAAAIITYEALRQLNFKG
ncbi:MAG: tRNA (uridine(34)/cytosine(34)/5-carboxymethylaminomethyluridine(34)-2'-O)-methyltransferase TrmL [Gammaproteobacteria bacterium]|nr:tRNA (uridine(34)/cytosine(34)/5-carboxymethylaminomethyluridine(34)-2'-O)-methyltransferase TrmL [Gammaproteobacteria bacterium]